MRNSDDKENFIFESKTSASRIIQSNEARMSEIYYFLNGLPLDLFNILMFNTPFLFPFIELFQKI